ncbi:MAG: formimidoylglutamate deiminase [Actinomycetia bacterium]|nr:formimidoylglutamate deiminase [Actinomycetes bacterium]
MARYWCELAWVSGDQASAGVLIDVAGDRIASVTRGMECPSDATRLAGLTLPGLANAHSHAFHRALRGRTQVGSGSFWTWREVVYAASSKLQPDTYFRLARAVYGEMALAGITSVGEFHYLHHDVGGAAYNDPNAMSAALAAAAAEAGIRITLLDCCYLHGGLAASGHSELNEAQQRFSDGNVDAWGVRADAAGALTSATCRPGAAVHSVRAVDAASIEKVAAWAAERKLPLHAHVSEQQVENEQCIAAYGLTPTALLGEHGAIKRSFTAVHATHLAGADFGQLGRAQCTVCLCPTTERDLADGIGSALALRNEGARLAVGSDSQAVVDLFVEARGIELHERLATQVRGSHNAPSLLTATCANGQRSLGWDEAGELAPGRLADFITLRLDTVRTAGSPASSALETAVFAGAAADVHHSVVAGQVVVADGSHVRIDVARELHATITELMDT